ncbi:MAG: HIRAN domain-containing protein [Christensenella sp.]|nr:HIRAN domain-containing protein [Christensenella sp.]
MAEQYVSIVGFRYYFDKRPFVIGAKLLCVKEPDNVYDNEAIKVVFPVLGTVGYLANSVHTKANGTISAGRIYETVKDSFAVEVAFVTHSTVIARVTEEKTFAAALQTNMSQSLEKESVTSM